MPKILFPELPATLRLINVSRAEKGMAQIRNDSWSAFLSDGGLSVKQAWVKQLLAGTAIAEDKGLSVLAAVNAALSSLKRPPLTKAALVFVPEPS